MSSTKSLPALSEGSVIGQLLDAVDAYRYCCSVILNTGPVAWIRWRLGVSVRWNKVVGEMCDVTYTFQWHLGLEGCVLWRISALFSSPHVIPRLTSNRTRIIFFSSMQNLFRYFTCESLWVVFLNFCISVHGNVLCVLNDLSMCVIRVQCVRELTCRMTIEM